MLQLHVILHLQQNEKTGLLRDMSPRTDLSVVYDRDTVYSNNVHTFIRHMYLSNANSVDI